MQNETKKAVDIHYATVCFFVEQAQSANGQTLVHLAVKARKVGTGFRNGYGGHIKTEENETPRQCAVREVFKESGGVIIDPVKLRYVAFGDFVTNNDDGTETLFKVNFFIADQWTGTFRDTPEMFDCRPYPINNLPTKELMLADREWLKVVLLGNTDGKAQFYMIDVVYGPGQKYLAREVSVMPNRQLHVS